MNERDLIPLETGGVRRTPTSGGDRLMVLLAGLALAGGLAIAVGNLLPPPAEEVAQASTSASAAPTSRPTRTPRPTPTEPPLRQMVVTPGDPPDTSNPFLWNQEWIRAIGDLPIRSAPMPQGFVLGTLAAGEVALVQQSDGNSHEPGWLYVADGAPQGWVQVEDGATPLVERYPTDPGSWAHLYVQLQAGDGGFIAQTVDGTAATSPTGATWTRYESTGQAAGPTEGWPIAWGPAGWIGLSFGDRFFEGTPGVFLWRSDDGRGWTPLGRISPDAVDFNVNSLWGSPIGYLLWGSDSRRESFWFSTNGLAWLEMSRTGLAPDTWLQIVGTSFGFYVSDGQESSRQPIGAFTADGATWQPVTDGPHSPSLWMAPLGDQLIAVDRDLGTGAMRTWTGSLGPGGFAWGQVNAGTTFDGIVPALLTGDGDRVVMIGWERSTEIVRSWASRDGVTWTPLSSPSGGFGGIPHQAIGSAAGTIVLGVARDDGLEVVQPWRLVGNGWRPVDLASVLGLDYPAAMSCPPPPSSALEFVTLDAGVAVHCFGHQPIHFRAYSVACDGCSGGPDPSFSPTWLAAGEPPLHLAPIETENPSWLDIVLDPSVEPSRDWEGTWVEVVGHFDDPAALDCRQQLDRDSEMWYAGRQQLVDDCRRRFVITQVTVVDGP